MYYEPSSVHATLLKSGWVLLATGPEDTQCAPALLRHRVYGAAARMKRKAGTSNRVPGFILGWLKEE